VFYALLGFPGRCGLLQLLFRVAVHFAAMRAVLPAVGGVNCALTFCHLCRSAVGIDKDCKIFVIRRSLAEVHQQVHEFQEVIRLQVQRLDLVAFLPVLRELTDRIAARGIDTRDSLS